METHQLILGLAGVLALGSAAQWLSWRLRQPSILLLLSFGFLAGPVTGLLDPDALLGDLLMPFVSLAVALILFEGGLTLKLSEIRDLGGVLGRLVLLGGAITLATSAGAAHVLLGLGLGPSFLLGAVLVVSGPTVILPILRHVRPGRRVASLLKWEAMVIDPIGVMAAVIIFQALLATGPRQATTTLVLGVLKTLAIGGCIGAGAALVAIAVLRPDWVPDHLDVPVLFVLVIVSFAAANHLQHESGLVAVTLTGAILANQRRVVVRHVLEFKENLSVLLLGALFILLAARLGRDDLASLGWRSLAFLGVLLLVARPVSVLASCLGSDLSWRERAFVGWMHPRGVVSAAVAAIFALRLEDAGREGAHVLVPVTFLVIVGTIVVYGASAGPASRWLGIAEPDPQGLLLVGAAPWARQLAAHLQREGIAVLLADTNWDAVTAARQAGLRCWYGNVLDEQAVDTLDLDGIGRLLALTPNDEVNALACLHMSELFERSGVFQLAGEGSSAGGARQPHHLRGRELFRGDATHARLVELVEDGHEFRTTPLTDEFGLAEFQAHHGREALPLFVLDKGGGLEVLATDSDAAPEPGQRLISLVPPDGPRPEP